MLQNRKESVVVWEGCTHRDKTRCSLHFSDGKLVNTQDDD
jgi:hypothetical protein